MPKPRTIVIAPDSFKGSLSAAEVAASLAEGWGSVRPADTLRCLPLADGGEGTMDAVEAAVPGSRRHRVRGATGPDGRPVDADWLVLPDGTGLVELAVVSGLPLMAGLDALGATTRGLGQLVAAACDAGCRRLMVTLGGSATTDGATGALRELGLELLDADDAPLPDGGGALVELATIDRTGLRPPPPGGVEILTDVDNPLLGPRGAAAVFGPQKGADAADVARLDAGLARLAELGGGDPDAPGAGAAGGAAYGFATFWDATTRSGSDAVAELAGLGDALDRADLVITGEGTLDATSLGGKVVGHVLTEARRRGVPVVVVAGVVAQRPDAARHVVSLSEVAGSTEASMAEPARWLTQVGRQLASGDSMLTDLLSHGGGDHASDDHSQPLRGDPSRDQGPRRA